MKSVIIKSDQSKRYLTTLISEQPEDGSVTVDVKKTDLSSTSNQRRLNWLWATEISNSGIGHGGTKEDVHIRNKWMFARPIWLRDDELFGIIYEKFIETVTGSAAYPQLCKIFSDQYISTERMSRKQRAEYLTDVQRYWLDKGVNLTDPATYGFDDHLGYKNK